MEEQNRETDGGTEQRDRQKNMQGREAFKYAQCYRNVKEWTAVMISHESATPQPGCGEHVSGVSGVSDE